MFENPLPGELVETASPRVTLRNAWAHPFDSAIAAARTCYAPRLIGPEEITDKQRLNIGAATFYSGHHTVYQHAHFEFGLENISRQFVWSFLHAHPFYNSEQQSQRYVRLDRAQAYIPPVSLFFDEQCKADRDFSSARPVGDMKGTARESGDRVGPFLARCRWRKLNAKHKCQGNSVAELSDPSSKFASSHVALPCPWSGTAFLRIAIPLYLIVCA